VVALGDEVSFESDNVPYDLDAEEAVLGSILIDPECIMVLTLEPSNFFSEQNQVVYEAMLRTELPNQITVAHELVKMNKLGDAGGVAYLSHLVSHTPTSIGVESYAKVVKDCAVNRLIISASGQIGVLRYALQSKAMTQNEFDNTITAIRLSNLTSKGGLP
jgi:replicative DNA helicase